MSGIAWIHLSDWHQRGADFDRKVVRDALLEDIRNREKISPNLAKINFIIFSGDVAYNSRSEEYESSKSQLFSPLLKESGLNPDKLFIVPGNHDLDRDLFEMLPAVLTEPLMSDTDVQNWLTNDAKRDRLMEPFQAFSCFVSNFTGQNKPNYANIRRWEYDGKKIALLGLNSAWMCGRKNKLGIISDKGFVLVGEPQIHESLKQISDADIKIGILHHPFEWLAEFDCNRIEGRLMQGCNFILHGHQHKPKVNAIHSTYGNCIIIPAGACYDRRIAENPIYTNSYNLVSLDFDTGKCIVFLRRWSEASSKWVEDIDVYPSGKFEFFVSTLHSSDDPKENTLSKNKSLVANGPFQVPSLPEYFVPRPEISETIKARLLTNKAAQGVLLISAIHGLGGTGKTIMATSLAHDGDVQKRYSEGILWANLGQKPDLLSILSGWIQELGDYEYHSTTIKAASDHLRTLLHNKRVLLVVDDAWCLDHVRYLLVGGPRCQALITTREYSIPRAMGAALFEMDVMTEDQSLRLFSNCLRRELEGEERQKALDLAKELGYLPLAIELAAAQVEDGVAWAELLGDLRSEVVKLESLDYPDASEVDESGRSGLSLLASFRLSYQRLSEENQIDFAWLGILPEGAIVTPAMTATLWEIDERKAGAILRHLRNKALLLPGPSIGGIDPGYHLHDLIHDLARNLIVAPSVPKQDGDLSGLGLTLQEAHAALLERYKKKIKNGQWYTLPQDGYIHNHLTWHMQMAGQSEKIRVLLAEETPDNKNGWYDIQISLGQISVFLEDVTRIKRITEKLSDSAIKKGMSAPSIGQEVRYALIFASINSLAERIPPMLYAGLVESGIWSPNQALSYAHQIPDEKMRSRALYFLASTVQSKREEILKDVSTQVVFEQMMDNLKPHRAVKSFLERNLNQSDLTVTLNDARRMPDSFYKAETLAELSLQFSGQERTDILLEALSASQHIQDRTDLEKALSSIRVDAQTGRVPSDLHLANYNLRKSLNELTKSNRKECLDFLVFLSPYIKGIGTGNAVEETLKAIEDVGRWWP